MSDNVEVIRYWLIVSKKWNPYPDLVESFIRQTEGGLAAKLNG